MHLFRVRFIFPNTSELEPFYIMARNEEEAVETAFIINARDIQDSCEITVNKIADASDANPE
jgi:UDP-N-acetyl-D-mannosaminuronate dehydrogenase